MIVEELEQRRATWQTWHVRAEAERQLRATNTIVDDPAAVIDQLVQHTLTGHSVSLAGPTDAELGVVEPAELHGLLRRSDGTPVYDIAGATHYTSTRILTAEQRLLDHAAAPGAPAVPGRYVDLAITEAAANRTPLDPGQAALVRDMATSGRRVQLAIAPAGTGKTTALRVLASAWTDAGGSVLGLAPSAAAAAVLGEALHSPAASSTTHADTLAKLTHTLSTSQGTAGHLPEWVANIGPDTLLLIDEAGTLTLDQVVHHAITQGATVRLIGDDQQLAAIGAGGVLRDIADAHGALRLDQLHRFIDPDEATATLLLRDGNPAALAYYLDHDRIHVGDQLSILDDIHAAWTKDRQRGLDALMLAPTRDQVRELNQRTQTALGTDQHDPGVLLADGLTGQVGDTIITRTNDRRLRLSGTDWVKNGDRWSITAQRPDGGLEVTNTHNGLRATLPADYVRESVELGYASTTHTAQGATADTIHGIATVAQTRQELYTMLTRGRRANHVYVPADATTGDTHDLITPGAIHPRSAVETLETVLANDGAATSATTQLALAADPALLLERAVERYHDTLRLACEDVVGPATITAIKNYAEHLVPDVQDQPAWPTLRARLIHATADGHNPAQLLDDAAGIGRLSDANDTAAVLNWRIDALTDPTGNDSNERPTTRSWAPRAAGDHPVWGPHLQSRQTLLESLADALRPPAADPREDLNPRPDTHAVAESQRRQDLEQPTMNPRPAGPAR